MIFTFLFLVTTFDLRFAPLVSLVQCHVSTKLKFSTAFPLQESRRHGKDGRTDEVQNIMRPLGRARLITLFHDFLKDVLVNRS